ncbi:hypothetical protein O6H91_06G012800 [Diphasiastrum complanatum]|uniref:Uncharacterized protein n=1 Tax=Diphasiastrum complanatum TaxID=34168 RepID=A0ACC2DAP5_DIPCM|nr:hypothetical protein O6H91_06G012800 [Diphasiastrum complanatum]
MGKAYPVVHQDYQAAVEECREKLRDYINEKNCAPIVLRLAWHSAGTFDKKSRTGGPFGTIRNPEELSRGSNKGLEIAVTLLEPIKQQFTILTYADFYQLAGVAAVEAAGGPYIPFHPGRQDKVDSPEDGRLPQPTSGPHQLRDVFERMGLSDKNIVALSGGTMPQGSIWNRRPLDGRPPSFRQFLLQGTPFRAEKRPYPASI